MTRAAHAAEKMVRAMGGGDLGTGMARLAAGFGAAVVDLAQVFLGAKSQQASPSGPSFCMVGCWIRQP